jgi:hypothetical protein
MKNTPQSRQNNLVVQELESELLIYDLSTNKVYCLNETSGLVYQLADGKRTVEEIADAMSVKLKTLVNAEFVRLALHELNGNGLIANADEMKSYFAGINRREAVKKIGLASMIALPLVSSVVAPNAASAQSGAPALPRCSRVTGVCYAGDLVCGNLDCAGILDYTRYNSMDGSCSGGILDMNSIDCSRTISVTSSDFIINSFT